MRITHFFRCPECGKRIILKTKTRVDTFFNHQDKFKAGIDDTLKHVTVNDYSFVVDSQRWKLFFAASTYLSQEGYQMLVNSFVSWANPQVTEIEEKVSGLVSKETFIQFFKTTQEKEEDQTEE